MSEKLSKQISQFEAMLTRERGPINIEHVRRFSRKAKRLESQCNQARADADALLYVIRLVERADKEKAIPPYLSNALETLPDYLKGE